MKCEDCGRQMFKNETTCPYCGRVYGPSQAVQKLLMVVIVGLLVWVWFTYFKG